MCVLRRQPSSAYTVTSDFQNSAEMSVCSRSPGQQGCVVEALETVQRHWWGEGWDLQIPGHLGDDTPFRLGILQLTTCQYCGGQTTGDS